MSIISNAASAGIAIGLFLTQTADAQVSQRLPLDGPVMHVVAERARAGDAEAMIDMAGHMTDRTDTGQHESSPDALAWLARAATTGDGEALYLLGTAYREGDYGVVVDKDRGTALLKQAAQKGNGNAIYELDFEGVDAARVPDGAPYPVPEGDSVERLRWDMRMIERLESGYAIEAESEQIDRLSKAGYGAHITEWRQAFQTDLNNSGNGGRDAIDGVAQAYLTGQGVAPDSVQAENWFQRLGEVGTTEDQLDIARHYEGGDFGLHREAMALAYYTRGAARLRAQAVVGNNDAQAELGLLYENGKLDEPDADAQAFHWYSEAANANDLDAEAGLARLSIAGRGTEKDVPTGVKWLTLAANNNNQRMENESRADRVSQLQHILGGLYHAGKAVPQDFAQAYYWLQLAMDNRLGDASTEAEALYNELDQGVDDCRKHLTATEIDKVRADIDAWHERFDPKAGY